MDLTIDSNTLYKNIDFGFDYSSFTFEVGSETNFTNAYYKTENNAIFYLDSIPTTDQPSTVRRSPFLIPNTVQHLFTFYSGNISGKIRLFLFYAPPLTINLPTRLGKEDQDCEKPNMVKGSTWRQGLPASIGQREKHNVSHCIIHHAASSNSNHNYLSVIRNIYLLHTQSNGWDDIGYNFVVAQDGTIFEGREHQNIDSSDNIKGAHFCGKNGGTMGICMLGNYQNIAPTQDALASLKKLLTWKCFKDNINVQASSAHPNTSSAQLAHIAGHQDGCATACPGDSVYRLLNQIRRDVDSMVSRCSNSSQVDLVRDSKAITWYYKTSTSELISTYKASLNLTKLNVISMDGKVVRSMQLSPNHNEIKVKGLKPGLYTFNFLSSNKALYTQRIWAGE